MDGCLILTRCMRKMYTRRDFRSMQTSDADSFESQSVQMRRWRWTRNSALTIEVSVLLSVRTRTKLRVRQRACSPVLSHAGYKAALHPASWKAMANVSDAGVRPSGSMHVLGPWRSACRWTRRNVAKGARYLARRCCGRGNAIGRRPVTVMATPAAFVEFSRRSGCWRDGRYVYAGAADCNRVSGAGAGGDAR